MIGEVHQVLGVGDDHRVQLTCGHPLPQLPHPALVLLGRERHVLPAAHQTALAAASTASSSRASPASRSVSGMVSGGISLITRPPLPQGPISNPRSKLSCWTRLAKAPSPVSRAYIMPRPPPSQERQGAGAGKRQ